MALRAFASGTIFGDTVGMWPPEVVALHGWGRTRADWSASVAGLDALALDLPGFGASPEPDAVWGAREYAVALGAVLDEIDRPVVLAGHSRGGCVAVCLAAARPTAVTGLVLTGAPLLRPPDQPRTRPALAFRLGRTLHRAGLLPESRMEALRQRYGSADYRAAAGRMRAILVRMVNESYAGELEALEVPVELVWGADDAAVPVAVARAAADLVPHARITVLPGVDHHVPLHAPGELRAAIDRVLGVRP